MARRRGTPHLNSSRPASALVRVRVGRARGAFLVKRGRPTSHDIRQRPALHVPRLTRTRTRTRTSGTGYGRRELPRGKPQALIFLLCAMATPAFASAEGLIEGALASGAGLSGASAALLEVRLSPARGCKIEHAEAPRVDGSARYAVKLSGRRGDGRPCETWAWVRATVRAPAYVAQRPIRQGEPIAGSVAQEEREVKPGRRPLPSIHAALVARHAIPAGAVLEEEDAVERALLPNTPIAVEVRAGSLTVVREGRVVPCESGFVCARLKNGRKVRGGWRGGRIVLEVR